MRQLPSGFSVGKSGDEPPYDIDEEEDLVTPVQQKLLQKILKNVTPLKKKKREDSIPLLEEDVTPIKPCKRNFHSHCHSTEKSYLNPTSANSFPGHYENYARRNQLP